MHVKLILASIIFLLTSVGYTQPTVGTIFLDKDTATEGYTLIYPNNQSSVFLLNNCGEVVNQWDLDTYSRPGTNAFLDSLGNLYVASLNNTVLEEPSFGTGGGGGLLQKFDWDGNLLDEYRVANSIYRQHHDFLLMPSGNWLILAWEYHDYDSIEANGFNIDLYPQSALWSDAILEYDPTIDSVVWEWHSWNHLVQDYDTTKLNFGNTSNRHKLNINYQEFTAERQDWLHCNSIDYDPQLDQIVISSKNFNEVWIIDHSTSTLEASTCNGGNSGLGGDILYRWGNPKAYNSGTSEDRKLFNQHSVNWINNRLGMNHGLLLFNNTVPGNISLAQSIELPFDANTFSYTFDNQSCCYLPLAAKSSYSHPDTLKNFSQLGSSVQLLDNNHILMCAAKQGRVFELDPKGALTWEYVVPLRNGANVEQGFILGLSDNFTFQALKYTADYFYPSVNLDSENLGFLELNSQFSFCSEISSIQVLENLEKIVVSPNPVFQSQSIMISGIEPEDCISIINNNGIVIGVVNGFTNNSSITIDIGLIPGVYFLYSKKTGASEKFIVLEN